MKNIIYLNDADGRKPAQLKSFVVRNSDRQLAKLREYMSGYWGVNEASIEFAQNTSTHLAYCVEIIKRKYPNVVVFLDSHEIGWLRRMFALGALPVKTMTYGNYKHSCHPYQFPRSDVVIFTPSNLISLRKRYQHKTAIVVLSHISRQSGEVLATPSLLRNTAKFDPETFFLIDGAQGLGAIPDFIKKKSCAYLTVSSKFIGAEPHLGIVHLSQRFKNNFTCEYPRFYPDEYAREIYSAVSELGRISNDHSYLARITLLRKLCLEKMREIPGVRIVAPPTQVPWLVTIAIGSERKTYEIVKRLKETFDIIVYHNISYSVCKPTVPMIRISISPRTTMSDVKILIQGLKQVLENSH